MNRRRVSTTPLGSFRREIRESLSFIPSDLVELTIEFRGRVYWEFSYDRYRCSFKFNPRLPLVAIVQRKSLTETEYLDLRTLQTSSVSSLFEKWSPDGLSALHRHKNGEWCIREWPFGRHRSLPLTEVNEVCWIPELFLARCDGRLELWDPFLRKKVREHPIPMRTAEYPTGTLLSVDRELTASFYSFNRDLLYLYSLERDQPVRTFSLRSCLIPRHYRKNGEDQWATRLDSQTLMAITSSQWFQIDITSFCSNRDCYDEIRAEEIAWSSDGNQIIFLEVRKQSSEPVTEERSLRSWDFRKGTISDLYQPSYDQTLIYFQITSGYLMAKFSTTLQIIEC